MPPARSSTRWPGRTPDEVDGEALPQPVQAARHEVVHHVVLAGDRVEHAAHAPRLLVRRNVLVAEVRAVRRSSSQASRLAPAAREPVEVVLPQLVLALAEVVQVVPGVDAGCRDRRRTSAGSRSGPTGSTSAIVTSCLPTCSVSWPGPWPRTSADGEYTRRNSYGSLNARPSSNASSSTRDVLCRTMPVGVTGRLLCHLGDRRRAVRVGSGFSRPASRRLKPCRTCA